MNEEISLSLDAWLTRVRNNLNQLEAMDQKDERRESLMRETTALFDAAKEAGIDEHRLNAVLNK
jgi:molybdenum cofactor biosynthesis enzyme MoaA